MNDAEAFAHYDDPGEREPASGAARRRADRPLTGHVPVRFPSEMIRRVEKLAKVNGVTASAWIRRAVEETLRRRG